MSEDTIINLAEKTGDNRHITVKEMLNLALKEMDEKIVPNRAVLLMLHDKDGVYATKCYSANISNSQSVSLLELRKHMFLEKLV